MSEHCDRAWEIDALREGRLGAKDAEAFERHLRTCAACTETRARNRRLRELANELPKVDAAEMDLRRLRARVLRDVELKTPSQAAIRNRLIFAVVSAIAMLTILVTAHRRNAQKNEPLNIGTQPTVSPSAIPTRSNDSFFAGSVTPSDGARWAQSRADQTEHVRLDDGTLNLHVRHQAPDEHFFVDMPDGQVEVRGTTFLVEVSNGATSRIEVSEGVVAVRMRGSTEASLTAGQHWNRLEPIADAVHRTNSSSSSSAVSAASVAEQRSSDAYAAAVALFQRGSYDAAAKSFADFLVAYPNSAQSEDASYLEAASLARAGRPDAAALAAEHHLAAYPRSFHGKDAAILIARAARDRGDCAKARDTLAPWLGPSPDAEAVATLRSCAAP